MSLKNILRPTKGKILADLIFSAAMAILILSVPYFGIGSLFAGLTVMMRIANIALSLLISMIIYYPLICGFAFFSRFNKTRRKWKKVPKEKPRKIDFIIAIILILIFNPITLGFAYSSVIFLNQSAIGGSCGMQIAEFAEPSPAKDTGISALEIITSLDNTNVTDSGSLLNALASKRPGDVVIIGTNEGNYSVTLAANPNNPDSAFLGVKLREKFCAK